MRKSYYLNNNILREIKLYIFLTILLIILNALFYINGININETFLIGIRIVLFVSSILIISGYVFSTIFFINRYNTTKIALSFNGNEILNSFIYVKIGIPNASLMRFVIPVKSIPYISLGKITVDSLSGLLHSNVDVKEIKDCNTFIKPFLSIFGYDYGECFCDIKYEDIIAEFQIGINS